MAERGDGHNRPSKVVGLIADPGIAQGLADKVHRRLEEKLNSDGERDFNWQIMIDPLSLPLNESGSVILDDNIGRLRQKYTWDYIIYLTDAPHYEHGRPVRSTLNPAQGSATLSLPSLGLVSARTVARALDEVLGELATGNMPDAPPSSLGKALSVRGSLRADEDGTSRIESIEGFRGRVVLTLGMIRINRPWRLVPQLSSAMAGAAATGAFGVFYTSIWSMADYLSSARLAFITLASIVLLSLWLLFHNRLWEKPRGHRRKERMLIYNVATVLTVGLAAAAMYVLLFLALLVAAVVVIDQEFLGTQLGHEVSLAAYLNLAWLAASLGTLGGAIGSSFDDVHSVQRATFSQREYERRNLSLDNEDDL
ncbi:hypothetical protein [Glutamicibacter sp. NPDC087344]|uniref:hypothetical protein n=1 Tax=Glutamicibacter sp. NPDC087344 TaxID=3363994 RepID=UPI00382C07BD